MVALHIDTAAEIRPHGEDFYVTSEVGDYVVERAALQIFVDRATALLAKGRARGVLTLAGGKS